MSALRIVYCAVTVGICALILTAYAAGLVWFVWTYLP